MKKTSSIVLCLFTALLLAGCSSTKVSKREILVTEKIPRPGTIWVYNFVATPKDIPADSPLAKQFSEPTTPPTPEELLAGYKAGMIVAEQLVDDIRAMGLSTGLGGDLIKPRINDIVIRGYLLSVDEGSATKRVALGFGSGSSSLGAAVEGYQMTANGLRKLGSGEVNSGGSKGPGMAVGTAAFIATANPVGLVVNAGTKIYGEASGSSKLEGRAKAVAGEIAEQIKPRFQQQGWIK